MVHRTAGQSKHAVTALHECVVMQAAMPTTALPTKHFEVLDCSTGECLQHGQVLNITPISLAHPATAVHHRVACPWVLTVMHLPKTRASVSALLGAVQPWLHASWQAANNMCGH